MVREVARLHGDDAPTIDELVADWLPTVYAWCARLGAGRIDAEEAAHDVMMLLVRKHAAIEGVERLPSWLFATCRRVVANHRRRVWWQRWLPGVSLEQRIAPERTDGPADQRELCERVARVLDRLSDEHREVLVLCYFEERSVAEAAALLGLAEGTVKSRLYYARAKFQARYGTEP
ncbi:MAG: sigma-70 family RNA polymerase sigma factor [Myxococcota bacterium]